MANICDNRFHFHCEKNYGTWLKKFKHLFEEKLEGEITWGSEPNEDYQEDGSFEGWFESRWNFPDEIFEKLIPVNSYEDEEGNEVTEANEDEIYFRCLSEEYGNGYVAMNIYDDGFWRDEQCFDI